MCSMQAVHIIFTINKWLLINFSLKYIVKLVIVTNNFCSDNTTRAKLPLVDLSCWWLLSRLRCRDRFHKKFSFYQKIFANFLSEVADFSGLYKAFFWIFFFNTCVKQENLLMETTFGLKVFKAGNLPIIL